MNWFYQKEGNDIGPLSEEVIRELYGCGVVVDDTPVRPETSGQWTSCQEAFGQGGEPEEVPQSVAESIKFYCIHCGQKISVEPASAGLSASCPSCGGEVLVPETCDDPTKPGDCHSNQSALPYELRKGAYEQDFQGTFEDITRIEEGIEAKDEGARILSDRTKKPLWAVGLAMLALLVLAIAGVALVNLVSGPRSVAANFADQAWTKKTFSDALELDQLQQRDSDEKTRYFLPNSESPVTGWVKEIDGNSRTLIHLKSGVRNGAWACFYKNGQLQFQGTYREGKKRGLQESWYENGQKESERQFEDALVSVKVWKPNGEVCPNTRFKGGNGKVVSYADDGKPYSITTWEDGKGSFRFVQKEDEESLAAAMEIARTINEPSEATSQGSGRHDKSNPKNQNQEYFGSPDFEMGFRAGSIGSDLPFTNREAYLAGRQFGEVSESMPAYTQGYNQGRAHGIQGETVRSNPFNKIAQKVEWLAWDHGYSIGNLEGQLSR